MAIYVNSGEVSSYLNVQGDAIVVYSGGSAEFTTIDTRGTMNLYGSAWETCVSNNGFINVCSGGIAEDTHVYSGGGVCVYSGGSMDRAGVDGGYVEIQSGGWGRYVQALSGGSVRIRPGGSGYGFTACEADITVMSGGTLYCPEVHVSGNMSVYGIVSEAQVIYGTAYIYDGGYANSTRISPLGSMFVYSGGVVKFSLVRHFMQLSSGGYAYDTTVDWKGTVWVSGGTLDKVVVDNGYVYVFEDGEVMNATLNSGGYMRVSSNGTANDTLVQGDARLLLDSGAWADVATVQDLGQMWVYGTANGVNVDYLGSMTVEVGGRVNKSVVNNRGVMDVSGTANGIVINQGGAMNIFRAGVANGTVIESDGLMNVSNGGVANDTYVQSWGGIEVYQNGKVSATTVISSGTLNVRSDGLAEETTVNENGMMTVYDEGMADSTTAFSHGYLRVSSGGSASNTTLLSGGSLYVFKEGSATETFVEEGGIAAAWGSNAIVKSTTVYAGGSLHISSGGSGVDTCLCSGGELTVFASGTHTGILYIENGACVTVEAGGVIDFDIWYLGDTDILPEIPDDQVLINDLSRIGGTPSFTLTVDGEMKGGFYSLAGGAADFADTITVVSPCWTEDYETVAIGELTVGGTLKYRNYTYSLDKAGDKLVLQVAMREPRMPKDDLNGDGRADIVMTIVQNDHPDCGATGAWLIQEDQTAAWGDLSQRNEGWSIFGMGRTAAGKDTNDVYIKSTGNIVGAWVTDDDGKVTGWETVGEFDADTLVLGMGDFSGNGQTDLLLRNVNGAVGCYFTGGPTDGTTELTGWNYFQSLGPEWTLAAIGDLNGDGIDDAVLKHDAGFAGSWLTQADHTVAWADLDTLGEGFSIVGCGDFNGDCVDDVLLRKGNYCGVWLVENGSVHAWMGLGDIGDVTVEQIADFNYDGIADLRIRTAAGDIGTLLVTGEDDLNWKYYGSVGAEWSTSLAAI